MNNMILKVQYFLKMSQKPIIFELIIAVSQMEENGNMET